MMTEAEWLNEDLAALLKAACYRPGGRKIRLLISAWCRQRWDVLDPRYQEAIEVGERFADGLASEAELDLARTSAGTARKMYGVYYAYARKIQHSDVLNAAVHLSSYPYTTMSVQARAKEKLAQKELVREIFGYPFRPAKFDPSWRTSTVLALANGIYEELAFDRLPILVDALQDAGCDNDDILTHLHDATAPHVRGCWALDLVLGKE